MIILLFEKILTFLQQTEYGYNLWLTTGKNLKSHLLWSLLLDDLLREIDFLMHI